MPSISVGLIAVIVCACNVKFRLGPEPVCEVITVLSTAGLKQSKSAPRD